MAFVEHGSWHGRFQLWRYEVSHSMLLLRRPRMGSAKRTDVLFVAVAAIHLPYVMEGLCITEGEKADVPESIGKVFDWTDRRVFRLSGDTWAGYLVAGNLRWHDDDLGSHEPSAIWPG